MHAASEDVFTFLVLLSPDPCRMLRALMELVASALFQGSASSSAASDRRCHHICFNYKERTLTHTRERESLSRSAFWFWDNLISPRWCAYWSFSLAERKQVTAKTRLTLHYFYSSFQPLNRTVATFITLRTMPSTNFKEFYMIQKRVKESNYTALSVYYDLLYLHES